MFVENGCVVEDVTYVNPPIGVQVANLTYLDEKDWGNVESTVKIFIQKYVKELGDQTVYSWRNHDLINFGVLSPDKVKVYYITIRYK